MEREIHRREFLKASAATGAILVAGNAILSFADIASAAELQTIQLSTPQPQIEGGNSALQLLQKRASIDKPALAKAMKLRPEQKITLGQPIGYPKK